MKSAVDYACFDEDVYQMLCLQEYNRIFEAVLMDTFFKGKKLPYASYDLIHEIESQILHESPLAYRLETAVADEEEQFVRNGVFKKVVPRTYNYSCCMSGMNITATRAIQMIDACHIIPFSISYDDTITNGLSLSPTLHRAFDRFLVTIDEDYRVLVSEQFVEKGDYSIKSLQGKGIILPGTQEFYPGMDNLRWHKQQFLLANHMP